MYIYIYFVFFLLGPCILAGYLCIHIWDVQTFDFVYMVFMVYGLYLWIAYGLCLWIVYGYGLYMDCMDICGLYGYMYGHVLLVICMDMCLWIVFMDCMGICMDIGS